MFSKAGIFSFCIAVLGFTSTALASDVSAVGSWSASLTSSDLAAGAGSDLRSPVESGASQVALGISNTAGGAWTVTVSTDASLWPSGATLSVRVVSTGNGPGTASSGGTYLILGGAGQTLLSGTGDRSNVQLQFRLNGVSVRNSIGTYSTSILYSVQ